MATAEQTVSAVLESTNKRYLVERDDGSNEAGSYWFERYSDGWVIQGGVSIKVPSSGVNITLPIEFKTAGYWAIGAANAEKAFNELGLTCKTSSTTQLTIYLRSYAAGIPNLPVAWEAKGYAS